MYSPQQLQTLLKRILPPLRHVLDVAPPVVAPWSEAIRALLPNIEAAATEDRTYNGWTNYETWAVHLWLTNDEPSFRYWRDAAATVRAEAPALDQVRVGTWTTAEAERFTLADRLKDELATPDEITGLWADLCGAALSEVNWHAVADAFLEE
jgi:hypothetical protein